MKPVFRSVLLVGISIGVAYRESRRHRTWLRRLRKTGRIPEREDGAGLLPLRVLKLCHLIEIVDRAENVATDGSLASPHFPT